MILSIRLQNFRSYKNDSFEFEPSVNIMVGPNGCGKTNLLEAILVISRGGSYRARDADLVQFNKPWARIDAEADSHNRTLKITPEETSIKTFEIDGKTYKRLSPNNKLPVVLFEPNHLQLLSGSPDGRRAYLDDFLEQIESSYGTLLRKYLRALAQRNSLLKSLHSADQGQLFPWNIRLSQLAGQIVKNRHELVEQINKTLPKIYKDLSGARTKVSMVYKPQLPISNYESHHLEKMESSIEQDIATGHTNYGPHRDDFSLLYDGRPAQLVASRGETRTSVLALKIVELEVVESILGKKPIFLLDDVFSELDGHRRKALADRLKEGQAFITTTDADIVMRQLSGKYNVIPLGRNE